MDKKKCLENIEKEIFMKMKFIDPTIKGVKELPEYKEKDAYNKGLRDCLAIIKKCKGVQNGRAW